MYINWTIWLHRSTLCSLEVDWLEAVIFLHFCCICCSSLILLGSVIGLKVSGYCFLFLLWWMFQYLSASEGTHIQNWKVESSVPFRDQAYILWTLSAIEATFVNMDNACILFINLIHSYLNRLVILLLGERQRCWWHLSESFFSPSVGRDHEPNEAFICYQAG